MRFRNKALRTLGAILFSLGFVIGLAVFAGAVWADFEAAMFDTSIRGDATLRGVRCPVIITKDETGIISAPFHNPLDRVANFAIRTRISEGFVTLMREEKELLPVAPGATERLEWTVTADDAAYGRVVLVRMLSRGGYPLPSRDASCGILVLDVPFLSGGQILTLGVVASFVLMALGGALWLVGSGPLREGFQLDLTRGMGALVGSVLIGMLVAFMGSWLLGVALVVITALLVVEVIRHAVQRA